MKNKKGSSNINTRNKSAVQYLHYTDGITLIALVTTIVIIMIFTSITVYTGLEIYENMKVENFVAKMITVQEAVDKLCEKYTVSEINGMANSAPDETVLKQVISQGKADELNCWYDVDDIQTNYRYFDINSINTILGIKDFDTAIWLNPISRNVIAAKGVEFEEKMYYRQYDLPGGQTLPKPNVNVDFSLKYSVKTYDNKAEIILYKSVGTETIETIFSQVKLYKQKEGTDGGYSDARIFNNVSRVTLSESGIYKIEATDSTKNTQSQENISVTIVNKPLLVDGMIPVKFIDKNNDGIAEMVDTTLDDQEWYNYGENTKQWANAKLKDGSVYVWIPRFAYEIDSDNKQINIKFLKEFSQIGTDGKTITSTYKIAPAFQDGNQNSFANGEWNNKITGFWVAKYETTENSDKPQNILIDKQAWRTINPADAFNVCRKMESEYKTTYFGDKVSAASGTYSYGVYKEDKNNIDTHLIKNSEWGAIAYLTHSKYGSNASNVAKADGYYIKNTLDEGNSAPKYSSTNNYTGIYGLNGGANEMVAAGLDITIYANSENKSSKYATVYTTGDITSTNNTIYGDAMSQTSTWNGNDAEIITEVIARGGEYKATSGTGVFSYYNKSYVAEDTVTFRPVIIVEYESDNSDFQLPEKLANKITAANYGDEVINYEASNGYKDWKIFYNDGTNVFIIASDYVDKTLVTSGIKQYADTLYPYSVYWSGVASEMSTIARRDPLFGITDNSYVLDSSYYNSRCASTLLDTANWTGFKDTTTGFGEYVIGSSTVEMWINSWNAKSKILGTDKYEILKTQNGIYGYYIGPERIDDLESVADNMDVTLGGYIYNIKNNSKEGYDDTLYFPHQEVWSNCNGYMLASPSSAKNTYILNILYSGDFGYHECANPKSGIRPVVALSSEVLGNKNVDGKWILSKDE